MNISRFRKAVMDAGGDCLKATNEWEVLRYRLAGKTGIVYRNKKGRLTPSGAAVEHIKNWEAGRDLLISKSQAKKAKGIGDDAPRFHLHTDASSYHTTGAGSWAAILVMPNGEEHEAAGELKGAITSSTSAEARAVANGLWHFLKAGLIGTKSHVRITCDNQAVANALRAGRTKSTSAQVSEAMCYISDLAKRYELNILADWVKGHQPKAASAMDRRVAFNHRCDALAKAHSQAIHQARKAAARERADVIRASRPESVAS